VNGTTSWRRPSPGTEITGVTTALNQKAAQLTGGQGWRGPVASSFTAAWQRDAVALDALAQVVAWTADVVDDLAAELAAIATSLEDAPPAVGEQSRALTRRQAHDRAMAAARRASERAAARLTDVHAVFAAGPRPHCPMGAGGSSEAASRNGMTALGRSGEKKRS